MKTPEQQHAPEMKTLHNIVFEPIIQKGAVIGYKSSDPSRKIIKLHGTSPTPIEGNLYEVEIVEDTDPDDPMNGEYKVMIKESAQVLTQEEIDNWKEMDEEINWADKAKREATQAKTAGASLQDVLNNTDQPKKNSRLEKKFGSRNTSSQSFLEEMIENTTREQSKLDASYREFRNMDTEGEAEKGQERQFAEKESLIALRRENLKQSIEKIMYLEKQLDGFIGYKNKIRESFVEKSSKTKIETEEGSKTYQLDIPITEEELKTYRDLEEKISEIEAMIQEEILTSPEAWYGYHTRELKEYRKQFTKGKIVELPSVQAKAEKLTNILTNGQPVFIHGHLGSGKTELARYISTNYLGKEFHIISGSKHMSTSEIYGHDVLSVSGNKNDDEKDVPFEKKVENRLKEWEAENRERLEGLTVEEREGERNRAQQRILASLEAGSTFSEFHAGPIYRAMEKGEPFIIDELNAIPHDILIGLNDLLTRRPGETVEIQQDSSRKITVAKGFCVIMTGNMNAGDLQKYVDRKELDPAFVNRIHPEEYDYLPQRKEGKADEADATDELYTLMMVMTMDRQANLKLPEGSLEKMWHLAEASRILQDVFSGKQIKQQYYFQTSGVNPSKEPKLNSTVMSLRNLKRIFDSWRNDGFRRELDYYLYESFVATSTDPNDKAYMYQILQKQFGFFKGEGWEQNPNYGDGKHSLSRFDVTAPKNELKKPIVFMSPRETVDAVYGKKAPERKVWPRINHSTEILAEETAEALAKT